MAETSHSSSSLEVNYLESASFLHVEKSLGEDVNIGEYVEVTFCFDDLPKIDGMNMLNMENVYHDSYWPAQIILTAKNLLRLKWVSTDEVNLCKPFWHDINCGKIFPIGHSSKFGLKLSPPKGLYLQNLQELHLMLRNKSTVDDNFLLSKEKEFYTKLQEDLLVEIVETNWQSTKDLYKVSLCCVLKNIGGRLKLLILNNEDNSEEKTFQWKFFMDPCLKPFGWTKENTKYSYTINDIVNKFSNQTNPKSYEFIFNHNNENKTKNDVLIGMNVGVISSNRQKIYKAVISEILDDYFFVVEANKNSWITNLDDPYIFPTEYLHTIESCSGNNADVTYESCKVKDSVNYVNSNTILNENEATNKNIVNNAREFSKSKGCVNVRNENLNSKADNVNSMKIPKDWFKKHKPYHKLGFSVGQKLQAVCPNDSSKLRVATISGTFHHMLRLNFKEVKSINENNESYYIPAESMELFPLGWAETYGHDLISNENIDNVDDNSQSMSVSPKVNLQLETKLTDSKWCPRFYINHNCFPGPFINKAKVTKLQKFTGPGPISLVIPEILRLIIKCGYICTRVLRELESLKVDRSTWKMEYLKARFKTFVLRSDVPVPSTVSQLENYLNDVSKVLQSCPNLWSQKAHGQSCPLGCAKYNTKKKKIKTENTAAHKKNISIQAVDLDQDEISGSDCGESRPSSPNLDLELGNKRVNKQKRILSCLEINMESYPNLNDKNKKNDLTEDKFMPQRILKKRRTKETTESSFPIYGLEAAKVTKDPLSWTVDDVENYLLSESDVAQYARTLKEHQIDGTALMLLNLPSLIHHLKLPHQSAVVLAHYFCKVKLAHFNLKSKSNLNADTNTHN